MGQVWSDSASSEVGRDFDSVVQGLIAPFKQAKNSFLSSGIVKVMSAPIHLLGTALIVIGTAIGGSRRALEKANKEKAEEIKKEKETEVSEPASDEKGDTAVVAAVASPEQAGETPEKAEATPKDKDSFYLEHPYYQEVFWFDDPAGREKVGLAAAYLGMDVKAGGNYLSCRKEDIEKISSLANCAGVSCCSLTDLTTVFTYAKETHDEMEKSEQKSGFMAVLNPADFASLRGQSPDNVVSFLHDCGISEAKLEEDGKIYVPAEELENFKAAEETPLTAKAVREASNKLAEMKMGSVLRSLGKHFKGKDEPVRESKETWEQAAEILAELNAEKDDHDDHDDGGPELTL